MRNMDRSMISIFVLLFFNVLPIPIGARHLRRFNLRQGAGEPPERGFRQVPLCVDEENGVPEEDGLQRFTWVFNYYKHNTYIPVSSGKTSPTGMITRFDLSAIKVDDTDSGYNGTLKNWIHIDVESAVKIEALYVQAISAPWGIPFGEFVTNFDCKDCQGARTSVYKNIIHVVPCTKRAALSYTHPTVFTIGGGRVKSKKDRVFFDRVHFNFRYTQYPCVDHTFAQFLVIAVREFHGNRTQFETFFTPVYELDVIDNQIGAYYPFYPGWDTGHIKCHDGDIGDDFKQHTQDPKLKLRYSRQFDKCVLDDDVDNLLWYTCKPGPIVMDDASVPLNLAEWRSWRDGYKLIGDPDVDPELGMNAQFCWDSGTWEWTVGQPEWPVPEDIDLIVTEETLTLNYTGDSHNIDDNDDDLEGFECQSTQSIQSCTKNIIFTKDCTDYHNNLCGQDDFKSRNTSALFGKDKKTGKYILRDKYCVNLTLTEQVDVVGIRWANRWVLNLHGKLMIFTWTVTWNIIAFIARFMKEYTVMERRSSYWGIGNWLWYHMSWTYIAFISMSSGIFLLSHQHHSDRPHIGINDSQSDDNIHDICNAHVEQSDTEFCLSTERKIHNRIGVAACFFFFLSYVSGWGRPVNKFLKIFFICYHFGMAYLGKFLFYVVLILGYSADNQIIHWKTLFSVLLTDSAAVLMYIVGTVYNKVIDKKLGIKERKMCPVPEGIDTYELPPRFRKVVGLVLLIHIIAQFTCFFYVLGTFEVEENLCKE